MKTVMRVQVDAERDAPAVEWLDAAQVTEQYGLGVARQQLGLIADGDVWMDVTDDGIAQVLSCPSKFRAELRGQIRDVMVAGGPQAILELPVGERLRLAKTSAEPAVLATLAQDRRSPRVRAQVAANRAAPQFVLIELADDAHPNVREAAKCNASLRGETLTALADRAVAAQDWETFALIALHPNLPSETCKAMLNAMKATHSEAPGSLHRGWAAEYLLRHPNMPAERS